MTDAEVAGELVAIQQRLAALAADPQRPDVGAELGAIRAHLLQLAERNETVAARLTAAFEILPDE